MLEDTTVDPQSIERDAWTALTAEHAQLAIANLRLINTPTEQMVGAERRAELLAERRAIVAQAYAALVQNARQAAAAALSNPWSREAGPALNGGRMEIEIRQRNYRPEAPTYRAHVSVNRHLLDNYWLLANQGVTATQDLNTIAYCSENAFSAAFATFGDAIVTALNARHYARRREIFDARGLAYDHGAGPRFETDHQGYNVHAFPVATDGSAVTLARDEHHGLKLVLRGMSADEGSAQRREGAAQWALIGQAANVLTILQARNYIHDIRRIYE